jgi:WhiB family redox-sensing transcriptional regulator
VEWQPISVDADPDAPWLEDDPAEVLAWIASLLERPAWHRWAACRGKGTALFFPGRGQPTEPAKAICAACVVRETCAASQLARGAWDDGGGIWGGMSERQRRAARRTAA